MNPGAIRAQRLRRFVIALTLSAASLLAEAGDSDASGLTRLVGDLADGSRHPAVLVWPAAAALLLSIGLFGIPVRTLRARQDPSRVRAGDSAGVVVLAWLAAACGVAFFTAIAVAVADAWLNASASAAVGSRAPDSAWLALPWIMLTAAASLVWLRVRLGRRVGRLEWTVVAGAAALTAFVMVEGVA
jgi:hypothetical protein